jgi:hypothetical protein
MSKQRSNDHENNSVEEMIDKTPPTTVGYHVIVTTVRWPGASRIRMTLFQGGTRIRHMDITTELARDLAPILQRAGALGAVRRAPSGPGSNYEAQAKVAVEWTRRNHRLDECSTCLGSGRVRDADTQDLKKCLTCNGGGKA